MKKAILVLWSAVQLWALEAPTLIAVEAMSDTSIYVSWRNNSSLYDRILILRRDTTQSDFQPVDSLGGTEYGYVDDGLLPSRLYSYCLLARSGSVWSDTSKADSVRTMETEVPACSTRSLSNPEYGVGLHFYVTWDTVNCTTSVRAVEFYCDDSGIGFLRSVNFGPVQQWDFLPNSDPFAFDDRTLVDTVSPNTWYTYQSFVANESDTVYSGTDTLFTFVADTLFYLSRQQLILKQKKGEVPLYMDRSKGWALLLGDSLYVNEFNAPDSTYSVIDLSNPANPTFRGYHASVAHRITSKDRDGQYFPVAGMIGTVYEDWVFLYHHDGADFVAVDSQQVGQSKGFVGLIGDSLLILYNGNYEPIEKKIAPQGYTSIDNAASHSRAKCVDDFVINNWRGESMGWTPLGTRIYDYRFTPLEPPVHNINQVTISTPRMVDSFLVRDDLLLSYDRILLDPSRSLLFAISCDSNSMGNLLTVFEYETQDYQHVTYSRRPSALPAQRLTHVPFISVQRNTIRIHVSYPGGYSRLVEVFNAQGKRVLQQSLGNSRTNRLDISSLGNGLFVLTIKTSEAKTYVYRFTIYR